MLILHEVSGHIFVFRVNAVVLKEIKREKREGKKNQIQ